MINISGNKQLDIILPNTNRALKEVLKGATPKELEVLTKSKDLKSVVNSLLNESAKSSASDKVLLQLLKNNPTLKDLGNVSTTIKELLNSIKTNQDPLPMEKILTKFIADMKKLSDLMPSDKKVSSNKNANTQVDSKLQTPQNELKSTLKSLLAVVEKSPSFPVKSMGTEIKNLINNEALKNPTTPPSTQSLAQLSKGIDTLLRTLQTNIKDVDLSSLKDALNSLVADKTKTPLPIEKVLKEFLGDIKQLGGDGALKSKITDSGVFLESKLKNAQNPQVELKDTLKSLQVLVEKSSVYPVKVLSKHIETMLSSETLKNASNTSLTQATADDKKALTQLVKGMEKIVETLKANLKEGDVTTTKTFNTLLEKLQHQMQPKLLTADNFKLPAIQDTMGQLVPMLNKSALGETKGLLDALVKILQIAPNTTLEQFANKKMPQELQNAMQPLKAAMSKADPLFSKDIGLLLNKLNSMSSAQKLSTKNNIKEILANDLKSLLLQTSSELAKSSHPNQAEILKNLDKLSLQIDYYQLMSHLSNSSLLYLPFSWNALEQGNINLKKGEEDKFYCDIELKLKEYGELSLRLVLYEENQLNIQIHSDNKEFKNIIKKNIPSLRSALIESHITPREIRLLDATKKVPTSPYDSPSKEISEGINVGFEIKA
ncbi:MAG: flagellar hook-length control protein FliK [Sulfurimonas sp.]|nr:MAG: flagellar hook-length control protein FliK [Sulfurimonas sp.]